MYETLKGPATDPLLPKDPLKKFAQAKAWWWAGQGDPMAPDLPCPVCGWASGLHTDDGECEEDIQPGYPQLWAKEVSGYEDMLALDIETPGIHDSVLVTPDLLKAQQMTKIANLAMKIAEGAGAGEHMTDSGKAAIKSMADALLKKYEPFATHKLGDDK